MPDTPSPLVAIVALPDCLGSAVLGMLDTINLANAFHLFNGKDGRQIEARVVSQAGTQINAFGRRRLDCDAVMSDLATVDAIVVAPVVADMGAVLANAGATVDWLARNWEQGAILTGVCTGTVLLAEAGILDNRLATTNPGLSGLFAERYPAVHLDPTLRLADEGRLITAGATTSSFDLVIELIGRFLGPETAIRAATEMLTDPNPQSQKPYMLTRPRTGHSDQDVQSVQVRIERDYGRQLDTDSLARAAAMSPRTLARRFRHATGESLQEYLRNTRIEAAMRRLAATEDSISAITEQCGYVDVRSFRRMFRDFTGLSPREYRARFSYARRSWNR